MKLFKHLFLAGSVLSTPSLADDLVIVQDEIRLSSREQVEVTNAVQSIADTLNRSSKSLKVVYTSPRFRPGESLFLSSWNSTSWQGLQQAAPGLYDSANRGPTNYDLSVLFRSLSQFNTEESANEDLWVVFLSKENAACSGLAPELGNLLGDQNSECACRLPITSTDTSRNYENPVDFMSASEMLLGLSQWKRVHLGAVVYSSSKNLAIGNAADSRNQLAVNNPWTRLVAQASGPVFDARSLDVKKGNGGFHGPFVSSWLRRHGSAQGNFLDAVTCRADQVDCQGQCVARELACAIANGAGIRTWGGNAGWGECIATSCQSGFELKEGSCVAVAVPPVVTDPCPRTIAGFHHSEIRSPSWQTGGPITACIYIHPDAEMRPTTCPVPGANASAYEIHGGSWASSLNADWCVMAIGDTSKGGNAWDIQAVVLRKSR